MVASPLPEAAARSADLWSESRPYALTWGSSMASDCKRASNQSRLLPQSKLTARRSHKGDLRGGSGVVSMVGRREGWERWWEDMAPLTF